jgi:transposase
VKPEQIETESMRREVARLKAERDVLKMAAAYFVKDAM